MTTEGWRMNTPPHRDCSCRIEGTCTTDIQNIRYADDLTLAAESANELQAMVSALDRACTRWGMTINATKTKTMTVGKEDENEVTITLRGNPFEAVESFSYLGSEVGGNAKVYRWLHKNQSGEGLQSVPEVEEGSFLELKCQQENQVACLLSDGMPVLLYGAGT